MHKFLGIICSFSAGNTTGYRKIRATKNTWGKERKRKEWLCGKAQRQEKMKGYTKWEGKHKGRRREEGDERNRGGPSEWKGDYEEVFYFPIHLLEAEKAIQEHSSFHYAFAGILPSGLTYQLNLQSILKPLQICQSKWPAGKAVRRHSFVLSSHAC